MITSLRAKGAGGSKLSRPRLLDSSLARKHVSGCSRFSAKVTDFERAQAS